MGGPRTTHRPVMLGQVIAMLRPRDGAVYVDGTFGAGGYSRALLDAADCRVLAIDRDPAAVVDGKVMAESSGGRLEIISGRFGDACGLLAERGVGAIDGFALDLGVSSMQLDDPARGFSFKTDGPLDMRMSAAGPSAADVVNNLDEAELAALLRDLGQERRARRIARAIVARRRQGPITRTSELAALVRRVVRPAADGLDPATRTFLALRIYVNDELAEVDRGLRAAENLLAAGGRLVVVAFQSLEDRRVKRFLVTRCGNSPRMSRHAPPVKDSRPPSFHFLRRKALAPTRREISMNPRARSARLRAVERADAPAWGAAA